MFAFALRAVRALACTALAVLPLACAGTGQYVWFSELSPGESNPPREYFIHAGDTVSVRVLGHEEMSIKERVRSDGRIGVPLIGEVEALGKRPGSLRSELEARLKDYIVSPSVMLNVEDVQPMTVIVLGEVAHPGAYTLEPYVGLAHALAAGGGLTEYAQRDRIFVVRQQPRPARIRFTFEAVSRNEGRAAVFPLFPGDVVVVE